MFYKSLSIAFEIGIEMSLSGSIPPNGSPIDLPFLSRMTNDGNWSIANFLSVKSPSESRRIVTPSLFFVPNAVISSLPAKFFDFAFD